MRLNRSIAILTAACLLCAACAGRDARPVAIAQYGDQQKSCRAIATELVMIEQEMAKLNRDSDKIAQNTVFGVTGLFLYVPLLFLDLSNAEREELGALRERYRHLSVVAVNNGCKFGKATPLGIQQPVNEPAR